MGHALLNSISCSLQEVLKYGGRLWNAAELRSDSPWLECPLGASLALGVSFTIPQRLQEASLCVEEDTGAATHGEGPQTLFHKTEKKQLSAPKPVRKKLSGDYEMG